MTGYDADYVMDRLGLDEGLLHQMTYLTSKGAKLIWADGKEPEERMGNDEWFESIRSLVMGES